METNLNTTIKNLFMDMINSPEKITRVYFKNIEFVKGLEIKIYKRVQSDKNVDIEPISLNKFQFPNTIFDEFRDINLDTDILSFYIETPYRTYKVPDFTRSEYAHVLDTIESSIRKFEERKLKEYTELFKK